MADAEAKAKAEKLAAAKSVELLKKQKAKKTEIQAGTAAEVATKIAATEEKPAIESTATDGHDDADDGNKTKEELTTDAESSEALRSHQRKPSLSVQSKIRSSSFRQSSVTSPLPITPGLKTPHFDSEEDTAPEIYRKQAARIEELEKENRRLAKEATEGEKRWRKAEEELEDLREAESSILEPKAGPQASGNSEDEFSKLRREFAVLQRQYTQLQAQASRIGRHGSSPSISASSAPNDDLSALLASKSSTIESMEIEISNLHAQLARNASGSTAEREQINALEEKLARTQRSFDTSQRELLDLKKNLERTTEKAVKEGSERTSAETKLRTLTREAEEAKAQASELQKKVDGLEKKILTLTTLHKEHDARSQALKRDREKADKEAAELRHRLAGIENDNLRMREERERLKKREAEGIDDEGVDELENEERQRLEARVRHLEGENFELRRGVWKERRQQIDGDESSGVTSPGAKFTDIDLGGMSPSRRRSVAGGGGAAKGLGDLFTNSFNAFAGAVAGPGDEALLEDDGELDFDEEAFLLAQEEEARKRVERVRELKKKLNDWKGWRLDLVELRRGGGEGVGEIFEI